MSTQQRRDESDMDRQPEREPVWWGCAKHRTPPGQECRRCADQGELFSRAETGTTRASYRRTR